MKFLFHAVTYTNGVFNYWNIYFLDKSLVFAEDLDDTHLPVRLKIEDFDDCKLSEIPCKKNEADKIVNALEMHLISETCNEVRLKTG